MAKSLMSSGVMSMTLLVRPLTRSRTDVRHPSSRSFAMVVPFVANTLINASSHAGVLRRGFWGHVFLCCIVIDIIFLYRRYEKCKENKCKNPTKKRRRFASEMSPFWNFARCCRAWQFKQRLT